MTTALIFLAACLPGLLVGHILANALMALVRPTYPRHLLVMVDGRACVYRRRALVGFDRHRVKSLVTLRTFTTDRYSIERAS